jgi:small-conductance mechanosensitive channel
MSFVAQTLHFLIQYSLVENTIANFPFTWMTNMIDPTIRISLIVLTMGIAIAIGLFLRIKLVRGLSRTELDSWVIQTLGVLIVIPPLIIGALAIPVIYTWGFNSLRGLYDTMLQTLNLKPKDVPTLLWNLIQTAILIALGLGIARTVRTMIVRHLGENRIDINIRTLIGRVFFFVIMAIVFVWILSIWQIGLGVPVAAVGIITAAVIVAIQDILKDLVAGFYILVERPFYIGNIINTAMYTGKVEDVQLRATKLRLISGEEVTIPNSLVFSGTVVNNSYYGERRATILITLPHEHFHQVETTEKIIQACKRVERVIPKPEPSVLFTAYVDNKITLTLFFWFASEQMATITDVMYTLSTDLPEAELSIKEPISFY